MGAAAAPKAMGQTIVGKKALCEAIGWTRPKLDRRLLSDRSFPVRHRGDNTGGWEFCVEDVQAYLAGAPIPAAPPAIDPAQLRDAVAPPAPQPAAAVAAHPGGAALPRYTPAPGRRSAHHEGEASARQRKDDAQAALLEIKLAVERGEYIPRAEVEAVAGEVFMLLAGELDALPEDVLKVIGVPASDEMVERLRKRLDEMRFTLHQKLAPLLDPAPPQG